MYSESKSTNFVINFARRRFYCIFVTLKNLPVMDDLSVILHGVEYKTLKLLSRLVQLENENTELKKEVVNLQKDDEENKVRIKNLEYKNNILKIANSIEGPENKTKAKLKINELLREVDRCLALLNK